MTLAELRAGMVASAARWDETLTALESASDEEFDARLAENVEAEAAHARAAEAYERRNAIETAQRNLPAEAAPVAGDSEGGLHVRDGAAITAHGGPLTYQRPQGRGGDGPSFFSDLYRARHLGDERAQGRLRSHLEEMEREGRAISTTAGAGGEFVPPVYLQEDWIKLPRAARPIANSLKSQPWVPGTNSINVPKVTGGTAVAVQTDGNAVTSQDITTAEITAAIQTVSGQQDVSQQLVDLSVPGIDVIIWDDIVRAYDTKFDVLCISGAVTNAKGLDQLASTNSRSYTSSTPTAYGLYPKFAGSIADVNTGIFMPPDVIAMHPLRWAFLLAALDTNNRPFIVPSGQPGFNAFGLQDRVAAENIVGNLYGIPVIIDASIPTNLGAGTNQDEIFVYRSDQLFLWEDTPRLRVFEEVLSGTLQVRFQMYNYYGIALGRLPKAISLITGTGLTAPVF